MSALDDRSMASSRPRILIAEDDQAVASLLVDALSADGYVTSVVGDGQQALDRAASDEFDLLILDIGLPSQDGLAVLHELRARGRSLPVLILSARSRPDDAVTGLYAGADDYISKPFDLDEVMARVRARLRDHDAGGTT
jgi:two-component system response regulator QseB